MDTTSPHLDDETLSAALDGVSDGAAAHLGGCAACTARRDQLAAARAAVSAAPVEPLDELTRRRLVAGALSARPGPAVATRTWRGTGRRRTLAAGGVAAAVLALLAAVPILRDSGDGGTRGNDESALAAEFLGDVGELSDPAVLRGVLGDDISALAPAPMAAQAEKATAAGESTSGAAAGGSGVPVPGAAPGVPAPAPGSLRTGSDPAAGAGPATPGDAASNNLARDLIGDAASVDRAAGDRCAASLARGPARGGRLAVLGIGTYRGVPAVVAAFTGEVATTAYVTARDDCRILTRYEL